MSVPKSILYFNQLILNCLFKYQAEILIGEKKEGIMPIMTDINWNLMITIQNNYIYKIVPIMALLMPNKAVSFYLAKKGPNRKPEAGSCFFSMPLVLFKRLANQLFFKMCHG